MLKKRLIQCMGWDNPSMGISDFHRPGRGISTHSAHQDSFFESFVAAKMFACWNSPHS